MKKIKLSQVKYALVDDADHERLSEHKWGCMKSRNTYYAYRAFWDKNKKTTSSPIYMHRAILSAPRGKMCDHINGDGLDNRKSNLRLSSNAQNLANSSKNRNNTSGFKGVARSSSGRKWTAQIMVNRKSRFLGSFDEKIKAAKAYDNESKRLYGEFARLNLNTN